MSQTITEVERIEKQYQWRRKKILKPFRDFILKNKKLSPDERTRCYNTAKCRAELKKLNEWYADVGMLSQIK